jgi:hypothetical protein
MKKYAIRISDRNAAHASLFDGRIKSLYDPFKKEDICICPTKFFRARPSSRLY